jgi:hypothetical protein
VLATSPETAASPRGSSPSSEDDDSLLCEPAPEARSPPRPSAVPSLDVQRAAEMALAEMPGEHCAGRCSVSSGAAEAQRGGWHIAEGPATSAAAEGAHRGQGWHIVEGPTPPRHTAIRLGAVKKGGPREKYG